MARSEAQECLICLNELQTNLAAVQCGHVFHLTCIVNAFKYKEQCPVCRKSAGRSFITPLYFNLNDVPSHIEEENSHAAALSDTEDDVMKDWSNTAQMRRQKFRMRIQSRLIKVLRSDLKKLSSEKKNWNEKYNQIALLRTHLMNQVTNHRLVIDRQANMIQRLSINKAVVQLLDTKDFVLLEKELIDPRDRILALKKACQYRTKQYEDAVKEKNCLKSALKKLEEHIQSQHNKSASMSSVLPSRSKASGELKRRVSEIFGPSPDAKKQKLVVRKDSSLPLLDEELNYSDMRPYANRSSFYIPVRNDGLPNTFFKSFTSYATLGIDRLYLSENKLEHKRKANAGEKITNFLVSNSPTLPCWLQAGHKKAKST